MSQRTIVEFNHDLARGLISEGFPFLRELDSALASGRHEDWARLRRFGIRRIVQCHHSDERKVVVRGQEYRVG